MCQDVDAYPIRASSPHSLSLRSRTDLVEPVDIILLAYNRVDYLREMVDTLERATRWPYRLTVVDNLSGPETRNWLRTHRDRFHQVIFNRRNEHLAGYQRGIARTTSELFVVSDADVLPHPPTEDGCWLTRLVTLAARHADFGLISARLDSITAARDIRANEKRLIDGELIETSTGAWLNLIRRQALRIPYMSDCITSYSTRRSGFRVGVAANVLATHLGDQDPERHPDYLARKQAASGLGTVYPKYPELSRAARPPLPRELGLAAPVLVALEAHGVPPSDTVELSREEWPPLGAVEPRVESCVRGRERAAAKWVYAGTPPPLMPGGAPAVAVLCSNALDRQLLDDALATAGEFVFLLSPSAPSDEPHGWSVLEERPGLATPIERLAAIGSSRRWQRILSFSTLEHRHDWLETMCAACFDGPSRLRVYVLRREAALPPSPRRWRPTGNAEDPFGARTPLPPQWRPPVRAARVSPMLTKASRLVRAEWYLWRSRR